MRRVTAALGLVSLATLAIWFSLDSPIDAPDWTGKARGFAYNPSAIYTWEHTDTVDVDHVRRDLKELARVATRVRTYSVSQGLDQVAAVAGELGLKATPGAWLNADREHTAREIEKLLDVVRKNPKAVDRVFVGNEVVFRQELTAHQLAYYVLYVKARVPKGVLVSTAETYLSWVQNPELVDAVDVVAAHLLPFWEGVPAEEALDAVKVQMTDLRKISMGKPVIIAEVGWPSEGRRFKEAIADGPNAAAFLRRFFVEAKKNKWD